MSNKIFKVLDFINRQGLDNSEWGVCENVDRAHFVNECVCRNRYYDGKWLYVWMANEYALELYEPATKPDDIIPIEDQDEELLMYKL